MRFVSLKEMKTPLERAFDEGEKYREARPGSKDEAKASKQFFHYMHDAIAFDDATNVAGVLNLYFMHLRDREVFALGAAKTHLSLVDYLHRLKGGTETVALATRCAGFAANCAAYAQSQPNIEKIEHEAEHQFTMGIVMLTQKGATDEAIRIIDEQFDSYYKPTRFRDMAMNLRNEIMRGKPMAFRPQESRSFAPPVAAAQPVTH